MYGDTATKQFEEVSVHFSKLFCIAVFQNWFRWGIYLCPELLADDLTYLEMEGRLSNLFIYLRGFMCIL